MNRVRTTLFAVLAALVLTIPTVSASGDPEVQMRYFVNESQFTVMAFVQVDTESPEQAEAISHEMAQDTDEMTVLQTRTATVEEAREGNLDSLVVQQVVMSDFEDLDAVRMIAVRGETIIVGMLITWGSPGESVVDTFTTLMAESIQLGVTTLKVPYGFEDQSDDSDDLEEFSL